MTAKYFHIKPLSLFLYDPYGGWGVKQAAASVYRHQWLSPLLLAYRKAAHTTRYMVRWCKEVFS